MNIFCTLLVNVFQNLEIFIGFAQTLIFFQGSLSKLQRWKRLLILQLNFSDEFRLLELLQAHCAFGLISFYLINRLKNGP